MDKEARVSSRIRSELSRALKFMNRFKLTEFQFKDGETGEKLQLSRAESESSPPLLEGRSVEIPGIIFSPAVGRITWEVEAGDFVEEGTTVAVIIKHRQAVEVKAPLSGEIVELLPAEPVEFGEKLARIDYLEGDNNDR